MATSDNWPVGYFMVCPSCNAATEMAVDDLDAAYGPYVNSAGVKMYNFVCPQCGTQNGISEMTTPKADADAAPVAVEPAEAVETASEAVEPETQAVEPAATSEPFAGHPSVSVDAAGVRHEVQG